MIRRERLNSAEKFELGRNYNCGKMTKRTRQQHRIHGILHLGEKIEE
jgi:hypothetical protein